MFNSLTYNQLMQLAPQGLGSTAAGLGLPYGNITSLVTFVDTATQGLKHYDGASSANNFSVINGSVSFSFPLVIYS
jgi:hypothetical protein